MPVPHSRRAVITGALVALSLTATACGQGSQAAEESGSANFETVKIKHALGEAVIESEPERVVTLGQGSTETAIALGKTPVGIEEYAWGSDDTGYMPWIYEAVKDKGEELPEQFQGDTELDVEAIAELEPDVILAPWSGITAEQYKQLDAIAPTVAYPKQPWTIEWDEQITTIGKALGQEEESEGLVDDIKTQLKEAKREEYKDLTFSYIYNSGPGTLGVFYPTEQRVAMVSALGLTLDPVIDELKKEYDERERIPRSSVWRTHTSSTTRTSSSPSTPMRRTGRRSNRRDCTRTFRRSSPVPSWRRRTSPSSPDPRSSTRSPSRGRWSAMCR